MSDETTRPLTVTILGTGSMGRAVLGGLVGSPRIRAVRATTRTRASAETVAALGDVDVSTVEDDPDANRRAVRGADVVVAAVKPKDVVAVLEAVADALDPAALVVSVAAGITTAAMEAVLPPSVAVVRAMPNTPALVRRGVTGLSAGSRAGADAVRRARTLFEPVGDVVEVPESRMDALSTVSGSGPAYVFYLIEELTTAAIGKGFSPVAAARLVVGTFTGAIALLEESGQTPDELRRQVTSPGGTTERALTVLAEADLAAIFARATDAALARARELGA